MKPAPEKKTAGAGAAGAAAGAATERRHGGQITSLVHR